MSDVYDVVIAGGGHNALIAGSYLAKSGLKVCIAERRHKVGGGVDTEELMLPGFKEDVCSVTHTTLMGNPLIRNDELKLLSDFGLEYRQPTKMTAVLFDDGAVLEFWSDLDRTCASIAKISPEDAEGFRRFHAMADAAMDMLLMGMHSVPPTAGMQAAMLDQTPEGQEMMRIQQISAWDLICEYIQHPKVRMALARYAAAPLCDPFEKGTGFNIFVVVPHLFRYGMAVCVGGSGSLADALNRCFQSHGGTVLLDAEVKQIHLENGQAKGLVLSDGRVIRGEKAVVAGLHVAQIFPHMVPGVELPPFFQNRIDNRTEASFAGMNVWLSLKEPLKFKAHDGAVDDFFWVERCPSDPDEFRMDFVKMRMGHVTFSSASIVQAFRVDPSRVPEGKGQAIIWAFVPMDLKDGGRKNWDELGHQYAQKYIEMLRAECTNLTDANILGVKFMTPLDYERLNPSLVNGNIVHIPFYNWQMGGNRPVPGWAQYRMPVPNLYLTGSSAHPGGGVIGGAGRNAAQVILEDLGLDFEKVCQ